MRQALARIAAFPQCSAMRVFPLWTRTLGAMIEQDCEVRVSCDRCREWRELDLRALAEVVGREYSLIDRRCACRLTPGCKGWNRFMFKLMVFRPLWTDERARAWVLEG